MRKRKYVVLARPPSDKYQDRFFETEAKAVARAGDLSRARGGSYYVAKLLMRLDRSTPPVEVTDIEADGDPICASS